MPAKLFRSGSHLVVERGPAKRRHRVFAFSRSLEDVTARVFCHEFHAELVSIAGVFRVFETIPPDLAGKPVQAWLDGDKLNFSRIGG